MAAKICSCTDNKCTKVIAVDSKDAEDFRMHPDWHVVLKKCAKKHLRPGSKLVKKGGKDVDYNVYSWKNTEISEQ